MEEKIMKKNMLTVKNLTAGIPGQEIIKNMNLEIGYGEIHVIMGPNGSGKSTLANVLMNNPAYQVTQGDILLDGESILEDATDKRAKKGLFMSFQNPVEVPGITVENFLRASYQEVKDSNIGYLDFHDKLLDYADILEMDEKYLDRYLNEGFSGGEKKKNEILQLLTLDPKFAILDETDSGLDVDAVRVVSKGIEEFLTEEKSVLIITHHNEILSNIPIDHVHVVMNGQIVKNGDGSLIHDIEKRGFAWIKDEVENQWPNKRKLKLKNLIVASTI